MRIEIRVGPAANASVPEARATEPHSEIVWQPQSHELVAASRAA